MKIIIDIDEEELTEEEIAECIRIAEVNFSDVTIIPKGHGDLIDRNILLQNWKVIPSRDRLIFDRYIQTLNGVIPADKGD